MPKNIEQFRLLFLALSGFACLAFVPKAILLAWRERRHALTRINGEATGWLFGVVSSAVLIGYFVAILVDSGLLFDIVTAVLVSFLVLGRWYMHKQG